MKLYDITKREHEEVEIGDTFRSIQVYECTTCLTRTNLWTMGKFYNTPRSYIPCPGGEYIEHFELERLLMIDLQLETKLRAYTFGLGSNIDQQRLIRVIDSIREEKEVTRDLVGLTRKLFEPLHNVVGDGLLPEWIRVSNEYDSASRSLRDPAYNKVTLRDYFMRNVNL